MDSQPRPVDSMPPGNPVGQSDLGLVQRIWGVFTAPSVVFRYLADRPHILGALVVLAVLYAATGFLLTDVGIDDQILKMEEQGQLDGADADQIIETTEKMMRIMLPVGWMVGGLLPIFIVPLILLFIANVLLGGGTTYRHLTSMMAHVSLVSIPMLLVRIPLSISQRTLEVNISPAAFLSADGDRGFFYYFLAQFDLFNLWMLVLVVIGVSILARIPLKKTAIGVVGGWLLWLVVWVPLQTMLAGVGQG